jgi:hypothetical protein
MEPTNVFGLQFDGPAGLRTVVEPDRLRLSFG